MVAEGEIGEGRRGLLLHAHTHAEVNLGAGEDGRQLNGTSNTYPRLAPPPRSVLCILGMVREVGAVKHCNQLADASRVVDEMTTRQATL